MVEHETASTKRKLEYNADYTQGKAVFEMAAKGTPLKLGKDMVLAEKIRDLIADKKQPYAVIQTFKNTSWPSETRICEKTLCNYIAYNVIPEISIKGLPYIYKEENIIKLIKKSIFHASDVQ